MTKEYEQRKKDGPDGKWLSVFKTIITIALWIVGVLFLLMVAFPMGLWVGLFE